MGFEPNFKKACEDAIASFQLVDRRVNPTFGWSVLKRECLRLALAHKVVSHEELLAWVTKRIITIGVDMADQSKNMKEYADHVTSPEALAYALQQKQIPQDKVSGIRFDGGDTVENFMRGQVNDLPERVLKQLIGDTKPDVRYHANDEQPRRVETG